MEDVEQRLKMLETEGTGAINPSDVVLGRLDASEATMEQLDERVEDIEAVVTEDPPSAVDVLILQKEIEATADRTADKLESMGRDIDRGYDMMKWVLGTLVLGTSSIVLAAAAQRRKSA